MTCSGPRVLVVDDHADLADSVCELLTLSGHSAIAIYSPDAALAHCREAQPDVAILDYRIGAGMNGIELLSALRRTLPDLIGILMTSDQDHDTAISSLRAGVNDYVRKPAEPSDILTAVERALKLADDLSRKGEEWRRLADEAEAAELNRSFLQSLGAEIREPLSLIRGNAELLVASAEGRTSETSNLSTIATDIRSGVTALLDCISVAKDLSRTGPGDDIESERVAVLPLLRDLCRKMNSRAKAAGVKIDMVEPAIAFHALTSKLQFRRMLHLFADSLLSVAADGSTLKLSAETGDGQNAVRMSLPAGSNQNELASGFGVALALAHRLGIAAALRLDSASGHEVSLALPAVGPS